MHERLERDEDVVSASPRAFGVTFAVFFAVIALWPLWSARPVRMWAVVVSAVFAVSAVLAPTVLDPLSRAWQRVGLLLHHVVNPIVMGVLFYAAVTPFGLIRRAFGYGLAARLKRDPSAKTYWIPREGSPPSSMTQQF